MSWLAAFALTLAIEAPLVALSAPRRLARVAVRDGLAFNLLTHPAAWLAIQHLGLAVAPVEALVWAAEAALYRSVTGLGWARAALVAAVANGASWAAAAVA